MEQYEWEKLSPEQKKIRLYLEQKKTLEAFLECEAISKAQFDKRLGDSLSRWECQVLLINHAIMSPSKAGSWIR